jgi:hypothetical protein
LTKIMLFFESRIVSAQGKEFCQIATRQAVWGNMAGKHSRY